MIKEPYLLTEKYKWKNQAQFELWSQCDSYGFIDKATGEEIESLLQPGYTVGIHRTGHTGVTGQMILDVFSNGLINNGDAMQGVVSGKIALEKTVSFYDDMWGLISQIKACNSYKNSEGVFIIKVPKSYIGLGDGEIKPIYIQDEHENRLLPEFIYGYAPVKKGVCQGIIRNSKYSDVHDYKDDGLEYDCYGYLKKYPLNIDSSLSLEESVRMIMEHTRAK